MPTRERIAADPEPSPRPACFSFAAYGKAVISHLLRAGVAVAAGLSDSDLAAIEHTYSFSFPPDLRSILREGLPVAAGFPDWRSSSPPQLRLLLSLPSSTLAAAASDGRFWLPTWGPPPEIAAERAASARWFLDRAPPLVPFYRHFYIPSSPSLASNPVFYVGGGVVRCAAADLNNLMRRTDRVGSWPAPAWAATSARRVDVWTEIAELSGRTCEGRGVARAGVERWLAEMGWRLKAAGWEEEEVDEMMAVRSDGEESTNCWDRTALIKDPESAILHVRLLALVLLRAGWSKCDVVEAMGCCLRGGEKSETEVTWQVDDTRDEISMEL